ncbi:hypothetical protein [Allopontixanthobacter sp.]|uniref:hypothetical protein n=1 Tax=Allopontixanthobacter sp. TaxID=2906452 RepID=UPI002AB99F95|nr:hypothetical protein [Allopontixanthobacter sp.]MDZ4306370.1 hypothetical protein [Allopontixanthobacter sp.]
MSLVRNFSIGTALAIASLTAVIPVAASAEVVVASSGPSAGQFPVGRKLGASEQITLKAGDTVTVLGSAGTRVISGAGNHRVGARGAAKRSTFATLTRQRDAARVRTGAVRGDLTGAAVTRSNLWYVDVTQSGTMCIADGMAVQLWRPSAEGAPTYRVGNASATGDMYLAFAEGSTATDWNLAQMPVEDGASYTIAAPGGGSVTEVTFAVLETQPDNPEDLAAALIAKGCTGQLELLSSALM